MQQLRRTQFNKAKGLFTGLKATVTTPAGAVPNIKGTDQIRPEQQDPDIAANNTTVSQITRNKLTTRIGEFETKVRALTGSDKTTLKAYQTLYTEFETDMKKIITTTNDNHSADQVKRLQEEILEKKFFDAKNKKVATKNLMRDLNNACLDYLNAGKTFTQDQAARYWTTGDLFAKDKVGVKPRDGDPNFDKNAEALRGQYQQELQSGLLGRKGIFEKGVYRAADGSYWHQNPIKAASAAASAGMLEYDVISKDNKKLEQTAEQAFKLGADHVQLNNPNIKLSNKAAKWQQFFNYRQGAISQFDPAKHAEGTGMSKDALHFQTISNDPDMAKMFVQGRSIDQLTKIRSEIEKFGSDEKDSSQSQIKGKGLDNMAQKILKSVGNLDTAVTRFKIGKWEELLANKASDKATKTTEEKGGEMVDMSPSKGPGGGGNQS